MASDLKSLAAMIVGGVAGVYIARKKGIFPRVFMDLSTAEPVITLPEAGLGTGTDNLPNTAYLVPAAVAVGAYFLL